MRSRVFFFLVAALFAGATLVGLALLLFHAGEHDPLMLLAAGLASVLFAAVGWVESPGPRAEDACSTCGGLKLSALNFCASCGVTLDGRRQ